MTSLASVAWIEPSDRGDRLHLLINLRLVFGLTVASTMILAPFMAAPLGRLSSPFALLVVLPPLALALESFGWRDRFARRLGRIKPAPVRLLATYVVGLVTSSTLTLDVAAVAAASVGIAVAQDRHEERRWQLGAAILGANVGSLLLPFSNLTNLVLVSASGIGFAAYVGLAVWPQLAAALAVGALLLIRARRAISDPVDEADMNLGESANVQPAVEADGAARAAGGVAIVGAAAAVAVGLVGGDMAVPFAASAAVLAGFAVASGRLDVRDVVRGIPVAGLAVIGAAVIASGPISVVAGLLPRPDPAVGGLALALMVGGLLAMIANNLPAAAFGAIWLAQAHPAAVVAFLIGTNIAAVATPHGSMATILARVVGGRHGVETPTHSYLRSAWRYASVGALAAMVALALMAR